ncbi:MAG: NAD(P)H-dependent oxidoreductase subunit E [Synergistaceae bacterium]|nr:NAD(P)H-dependent oxidoreductase subunit E [Synergistaceae bacterium]
MEIMPQEFSSLLEAYPKDRRYALAVMQDMQRQYNYVPREGLEALAEYISRPVAELFSMATFYKSLSLKPKGVHIIKVCNGAACHIRGAVNLVGGIKRIFGIAPGETTEDGMFSMELVNCMGSCALAPVMTVDGKYYGQVKIESLSAIFEALRNEAKP